MNQLPQTCRYWTTTFLRCSARARLISALTSLPLVATGCISAQMDIPEVEVKRENVVFPGVSPEAGVQVPDDVQSRDVPATTKDRPLTSQRFAYDRWEMPQGISADVVAEEVIVTAHQGTPDLSFVRRITLTTSSPGEDPNQPTILVEYAAPEAEGSAAQQSISLPVQRREPLLEPWSVPGAVYALTVWGDVEQLPRHPWAVDVTVTFSGKLRFEY